jgi:hypothetical protein
MTRKTPAELVAGTPPMVELAERKTRLDKAEHDAMARIAELAADHSTALSAWQESCSAARAELRAEPPAPEPDPVEDAQLRGILHTVRQEREAWRDARQAALGQLAPWFEEQWAAKLPEVQERGAKLVELADEFAHEVRLWHQQARECRRRARGGVNVNAMTPAPTGLELLQVYSVRPSYDPLAPATESREGAVLKDQEETGLVSRDQAKTAAARARLEARGRPIVAGARQ